MNENVFPSSSIFISLILNFVFKRINIIQWPELKDLHRHISNCETIRSMWNLKIISNHYLPYHIFIWKLNQFSFVLYLNNNQRAHFK